MIQRLLAAVLVMSIFVLACAKKQPVDIDIPKLTKGAVIAEVQTKGIPLLSLKNPRPIGVWDAFYWFKGEWSVDGYVEYDTEPPYSPQFKRSVKVEFRYYESTRTASIFLEHIPSGPYPRLP